MADIRTTIKKTVAGNKRIHYGTAQLENGTTSGTIQTDMRSIESFFMDALLKYTESSGVVTATFANPGEARTVGWQAIGY
jgi:hypothetical protein